MVEKPTTNKYPKTVLHTKDLSEVTKVIEELTSKIPEGEPFTDPEFKPCVASIFTSVDSKNIPTDM